jgi:hypothetical protein
MKYKTSILVMNKENNLNGNIKVEVRNTLSTKGELVQPVATEFALTREGAVQLIHLLGFAVGELASVDDYLIHPDGSVHVDGVYYNSVSDYLNGNPAERD